MSKTENARKQRMSAATYKNDCSSRSIAILRIRITDPSQKNFEGEILVVDMPGSEWASDC